MVQQDKVSCLVLAGPPGVGKSAVGREVAGLFGCTFLDLDCFIEQRLGQTVANFIRVEGEERFRVIEADALLEALKVRPLVLSLGGGAVLRRENKSALKSCTSVVLLTASVRSLAQRIVSDKESSRPLLPMQGASEEDFEEIVVQELKSLLRVRRSHYLEVADAQVDTNFITVKQVAEIIAHLVRLGFLGRLDLGRAEEGRSSDKTEGQIELPPARAGGQRSQKIYSVVEGGFNETGGDQVGASVFDSRNRLNGDTSTAVITGEEVSEGVFDSVVDSHHRRVFLVDENVLKLFNKKLKSIARSNERRSNIWLGGETGDSRKNRSTGDTEAGENDIVIPVKSGERSKSLLVVQGIAEQMLKEGIDRSGALVAVGGGVVGDLGGLVASLYMRGIELFHLPTTVVAQVDSAIGGKTGVNLEQGKNILGTFYPARVTLNDVGFLRQLPEREYLSGLAEVIKSALIGSEELFVWLEENVESVLRRETKSLLRMVDDCVKIKLSFVAGDARDTKGKRIFLNFGHTVGHALEKMTGYSRFLHGEAVSVGMVCALKLGERLSVTPDSLRERVVTLIKRFSLPTEIPPDLLFCGASEESVAHGSKAWSSALRADKKREGRLIDFVLVRSLEEPLTKKINEGEVLQILSPSFSNQP